MGWRGGMRRAPLETFRELLRPLCSTSFGIVFEDSQKEKATDANPKKFICVDEFFTIGARPPRHRCLLCQTLANKSPKRPKRFLLLLLLLLFFFFLIQRCCRMLKDALTKVKNKQTKKIKWEESERLDVS